MTVSTVGSRPSRENLLVWSVLLLSLGLYFFFSLERYLGAGTDDDYISLWTGQTLAASQVALNGSHQHDLITISSASCPPSASAAASAWWCSPARWASSPTPSAGSTPR